MWSVATDGVAWSVCQSVCLSQPWAMQQRLNRLWIWVVLRNCVRWGSKSPHGKGQFWGQKGATHCKVEGLPAVSPAKTVKPIEMPFGMVVVMGPGNHVVDGGWDPRIGGGSFKGEGRPPKRGCICICRVTESHDVHWHVSRTRQEASRDQITPLKFL